MSDDDMRLPVGKYCADCGHYDRCTMLFNCREKSTTCDWSPSRFVLLSEPLAIKIEREHGKHLKLRYEISLYNQFAGQLEWVASGNTWQEAEVKALEHLGRLPDEKKMLDNKKGELLK